MKRCICCKATIPDDNLICSDCILFYDNIEENILIDEEENGISEKIFKKNV